jgi:hypothetical protein
MEQLLALVREGFSFDVNDLTRMEINTLISVIVEQKRKTEDEISQQL